MRERLQPIVRRAREQIAIFANWLKGNVAVVVAALACAASWLTYMANDAGSRRALRAYLVPTDVSLECPDCENSNYAAPTPRTGFYVESNVLCVEASIVGQTPAHGVHAQIHWQVIPSDVLYPQGLRYRYDMSPARVIESQISTLPGRKVTFKRGVDVPLFALAKAQKVRLIVYGTFFYEDVFGDDWASDYCYVYEPRGTIARDQFTWCPEHNSERRASK
jgi:hypothetical protein